MKHLNNQKNNTLFVIVNSNILLKLNYFLVCYSSTKLCKKTFTYNFFFLPDLLAEKGAFWGKIDLLTLKMQTQKVKWTVIGYRLSNTVRMATRRLVDPLTRGLFYPELVIFFHLFYSFFEFTRITMPKGIEAVRTASQWLMAKGSCNSFFTCS